MSTHSYSNADLVRELREAYLGADSRFCNHASLLERAAAALDGPKDEAIALIRDVFMHPCVMAALSMKDFKRAVDFMDRLDATQHEGSK